MPSERRHWSREELSSRLAGAPLLAKIPFRGVNDLLEGGRVETLAEGKVLWRRGDPAVRVGLVLSGRLQVIRDEGPREVVLGLALRGELVGEVALALSATHVFTVVCRRAAEVLLLPAAMLRSTLRHDAEAAWELAREIAGQAELLSRVAIDLSAGSVEHRLARVMIRLADQVGESVPGGILVRARVRRRDLAAMAATTLESASRKISLWSRRGWVSPRRFGYLIRDVNALKAMAQEAGR